MRTTTYELRERSTSYRRRRYTLVLSVLTGWLIVLPAIANADGLTVSAMLDSRKLSVGKGADVSVRLSNPSKADLGPLELTVLPSGLNGTKQVVTLAAGTMEEHQLRVMATEPGSFLVRVRVSLAGRPVATVEAGTLDVVESPSALPLPVAVALVTAVAAFFTNAVTLWVTWRNQRHILLETRQQKAADAVAQIVLQVARDFYGAISGATSELAVAARRLSANNPNEDQEHLLVRFFFFFGVIVHKDNEFGFSQGLLFLPDLWAEADMRRMIDEILELVPLTQAQEAVIHKCFSDVAILQALKDSPTLTFKARNLYEVEKLLREPALDPGEDRRRIQEVFDTIKHRFEDADALMWFSDIERAMRALMEYEFTIMFPDFYRRANDRTAWRNPVRRWYARRRSLKAENLRRRPTELPAFDQIVHSPSWAETRDILEKLEARRSERDAARATG
jgi:hypothetical protein